MKSSPLVWWLFFLAAAMVGIGWMLSKSNPASAAYHSALIAGGIGGGILFALALASFRWAGGQSAGARTAQKDYREGKGKYRDRSRGGCVGRLFGLAALTLAAIAFVYLLRAVT
jgi:hypothetical protein